MWDEERGHPFDGRDRRKDWVDPNRDNRTQAESPYAYTDFFLWRRGDQKGKSAQYSDRLQQFDATRFQQACDLVPGKRFTYFTQVDCTKFLSHYFGKPVKATAFGRMQYIERLSLLGFLLY